MNKLDASESGVFAIAPTPFTPDGAIDFDSIGQLMAWYDRAQIDGLTILGVMGEAPKLSTSESVAIIREFLRLSAKKIIVGVSAPGFAQMRELAVTAMNLGAAGVMIAPPNHLRSDESILAYYTQANQALGGDIPICIQDYPLNFSVIMTPKLLIQLVNAIPTIQMIKHEDWPGLEKISQLKTAMHNNQCRAVPILCGNGGLFLDFELSRGADGAMTGYCFPELLVAMVRYCKQGNQAALHREFNAHLPLIRYEQQPNLGLAVRKFAMMERGMIRHDFMRAPAQNLSAVAKDEVRFLLQNLKENLCADYV